LPRILGLHFLRKTGTASNIPGAPVRDSLYCALLALSEPNEQWK
jgi:hypothetical protein